MKRAPMLPILTLLIAAFWILRFWRLGWIALPGNFRFAALIAMAIGLASMFIPIWQLGFRSRKQAAVVFVCGLAIFLVFQFV